MKGGQLGQEFCFSEKESDKGSARGREKRREKGESQKTGIP